MTSQTSFSTIISTGLVGTLGLIASRRTTGSYKIAGYVLTALASYAVYSLEATDLGERVTPPKEQMKPNEELAPELDWLLEELDKLDKAEKKSQFQREIEGGCREKGSVHWRFPGRQST